MAIVTPEPRAVGAWPSPEELRRFAPILRLLSGIMAIQSVRRVALSVDAGQVDLWVLMDTEDEDGEGRIIALERMYRNAVEPFPFDLRVVPLNKIDPSLLPPAETLFER